MRYARFAARARSAAALVALLGLPPAAPGALAAQEPAQRRIDSLLARMSTEEKLGQLTLASGIGDTATAAQLALVREGRLGGLLNVIAPRATRAAQRAAVEESRLGIPLLLGFDVLHGFRTIFPIPLAEASTWDPAAAEATARAAAREAAAAGVNWTFAPMVDIARDPRWGRIAEGAGEDPYLGAAFAAARVRGFQGHRLPAPDALLATAKHFAAYGAAEGGRDYNTVDVSERTLREIYLPPFRAAVRAGVGSIMSAFNEIAGVPSSANRWLLSTVLREEWGFTGFVVSDWTAIDELRRHGVAGDRATAGALALTAGVDMDMESGIYAAELPALVREGRVPMAVVDRAVRRVLQAKATLGLFAEPYRAATPDPGARRLARAVAREAIVLLQNRAGVLPLAAPRTITVLGPLADSRADALGPWHGAGQPSDVVTVLAGIRARAGGGTRVLYAPGCGVTDTSTAGFAAAVALARRGDVVIAVLGEAADMSGEAASRSRLDLPGVQQRLLEAVVQTGRPVVLVLMNGRPLALPWAAEHVPAILETWFLGVETGHAVADVLFGDVAPSGKLPVTIPRAVGQIPIYYDHKSTGRPPSPADRFTSKYLDLPSTPLYPFGWGLSYTTFRYDNLRVTPDRLGPGDTLRVQVTITNTGARAGTEVAQLYVRQEVASVTRPVRELAGFQRVTLESGEARSVEFLVPVTTLAFYGAAMTLAVEPGPFQVFVGPNSAEGLAAPFTVTAAPPAR
jgi:beta-glucosidase